MGPQTKPESAQHTDTLDTISTPEHIQQARTWRNIYAAGSVGSLLIGVAAEITGVPPVEPLIPFTVSGILAVAGASTAAFINILRNQ